jgi:lysophospholipase
MTLVSTPGNLIPAGVTAGKINVPNSKIELRFARWDSPERNRGTVCVFQGRTEFIEKYFETVTELRQRGFTVATMDWRGQDFSEFEADVDAFMHQVVLPNCPQPYFALAHSMGGGALVRVAHSGKQKFERYVLSSPMIDLHGLNGSWAARVLARALRLAGRSEQYVPGGNGDLDSEFKGNELTSDPGRFARNAAILKADPTLGIGSATVAWVNAAFDTIDAFREAGYAEQIAQPTLMFSASDDTIVSKEAIEQFAGRLPRGSHQRIKQARHEILQEKDDARRQFWDAFDNFMR